MAVDATNFNLFPQERDFVNWRSVICEGTANEALYDEVDCDSRNKICRRRKRSADVGADFPATNIQFDLPQIQQQYQLEIESIISQHNKRIKLELQERQKQQTKLLIAAIGEGMVKKLMEKDEQIQTMVKLNMILQDRAKSLYIENQFWRDVAQTNEATTISLRTNLEHALAKRDFAAAEDESCCDNSDSLYNNDFGKNCKQCGEREARVLILPCRHLCLCNDCGGGSHLPQACPVCNSSMNATLHVNV